MFENKKINLILSLLLAIGLWIYVVGEVNPTSDETLKDIPITIVNMDKLEDRGLAISGVSAETVEIQVKGTRSNLSKLEKSEVKAILDVSEAVKGENQISVDVRVPDGIEVINKTINKVAVTVESLKTKEVPVKIGYTGKLEAEQELKTLSVSPQKVTVRGAESLVNMVEYGYGTVDVHKVKESETLLEAELKGVDKDLKPVHRVECINDKVSVTSIIYSIKTVELIVPIEKRWNDGLERKTQAPAKITIVGREQTVKEIQSLTAEPVEIGNVSSGTQLPIKITLPDGIALSDKNEHLVLKVIIEQSGEKPFEFNTDEVNLIGKKDGLEYQLESGVKINVIAKGNKEDLLKVDKNSVTLATNVSQLEEGESKVILKGSCTVNGVTLVVTPETIKITVRKQ